MRSWRLVCVGALGLALACESGNGVSVEVRTDYVPSLEFDSTVLLVDGEPRQRSAVDPSADYASGVRLADLEGIANGDHTVVVELRLRDSLVTLREVLARIDGDRSITVSIARSCGGTTCPAGPSGATSCLGGRCVDPRCITGVEQEYPEPQCATDSGCPSGSACSVPRCVDSVCYLLADDSACSDGLRCSPSAGCVLEGNRDAGPTDAGDDGSSGDAGDDAGQDGGNDAGVDGGPDAGFTPGGGLAFDGVDDVLIVPNGFTVGEGDWSLELWFYYPSSTPDQGAIFTAVDALGQGVGLHFINLAMPMRSGIAREETRPGCAVGSSVADARSDIYDRWLQLVVVSETTTVRTIYFDGRYNRANTGGMHSVGVGDIRIGGPRLCLSSAHTRLSLSNVRLWSRALGPDEIAEFSAGVGPAADAPGLVGWWPLDEGSGQIARNRVVGSPDGILGELSMADGADPSWR